MMASSRVAMLVVQRAAQWADLLVALKVVLLAAQKAAQ
jgi:hypothetical protein